MNYLQGVAPTREEILHTVAHKILDLPTSPVLRVGIDAFHHPRVIRYRLGRHSPLGYFRDSYNYAQLKAVLLDPLSPGGTSRYRTAMFDHRLDTSGQP